LAKTETLDYDKIRDVLEGKYPPKVEEKPKPVEQATPSMAPTVIPKSPDVPMPKPKAVETPTVPEAQTTAAPVAIPESPVAEVQDRENGYETKVVLKGDRLRKYFPDVSMTPREIEDSIYAILEEHRQRQEKMKLKAEHKFTR
jgi:hypothetical protein